MKKDYPWEQFSAYKVAAVKPAINGWHAFWIGFSLTFYVLCVMKAYGVLY